MAKLIPQKIKLSPTQAEQLISFASHASPYEVCGILAGRGETVDLIIPITNISSNPSAYEMDPKEQIAAFFKLEQLNLDLIAFFHSHPLSPPYPSPTDLAEYTYPESPYLIIGPENGQWRIFGFRLAENEILQVEIILA